MIKVSVIMPAYNAAKYITESIESVIAQTYANWELIVVDDGSTDDTKEIVTQYNLIDSRIIYLWQQNGKQAKARNLGIKHSAGDWIAFIDADDLWLPEKLQVQIELAIKSDFDVIFTNGYYLEEATNQLTPYDSIYGKFEGVQLYKILYEHNYIAVLSVMYRRTLSDIVGFQDEALLVHGCEDWDFWLRMCRGNARFFGLDQRLFKYRVHDKSTSSNKLKMKVAICYVLNKNFDVKLLTKHECEIAINRIALNVKAIIPALYERDELANLRYYLDIIAKRTGSERFKVAEFLIKVLGKRSKRLINFILP